MTSFSAPGSVNSRSRLKTSKLFAQPSPARLGLDKKHFRPVFPSTGSGSSTHHTSHLRRIPRQRGGGGGCLLLAAGGGWWEEASVFCPWRPFTVRGQPGPAWATPHNCIILFKVLCWWRAVQPALFSNIEHRVCH